MGWMIFGNNIVWLAAVVAISAYSYTIYRRNLTLERTCRDLQVSNIRLTQHLDFLIRRFHLTTPPYVTDSSMSKLSEIGQPMIVRCWHCQKSQQEPHDASCPWFYVQSNIEYVNHRPSLRN